VRWPVRITAPAMFEVLASYDADAASVGGTFVVKVGASELVGTVERTPGAPVRLGRVKLHPGAFEIAVEARDIEGPELMRLRGLVLRPVAE
jgi:hypothetical protein